VQSGKSKGTHVHCQELGTFQKQNSKRKKQVNFFAMLVSYSFELVKLQDLQTCFVKTTEKVKSF